MKHLTLIATVVFILTKAKPMENLIRNKTSLDDVNMHHIYLGNKFPGVFPYYERFKRENSETTEENPGEEEAATDENNKTLSQDISNIIVNFLYNIKFWETKKERRQAEKTDESRDIDQQFGSNDREDKEDGTSKSKSTKRDLNNGTVDIIFPPNVEKLKIRILCQH